MKALERKLKRMQEKSKHSTELDENDMPKKKLTSIPSKRSDMKIIEQENSREINEENKIQNIAASRPANNVDVEKISQRLKERKERRKRKKMIEAGISPTFINDNDNNNNFNQKETNNNKNYISDKDSNKLIQSVESMAPVPLPKKVNFNASSNKNQSNRNKNVFNSKSSTNNNKINNQNSASSNSSNINNDDFISKISTPNYNLLSKNLANIKNENIEDFLTKTNPNKPSKEEKEAEVHKMIEVMKLRPNLHKAGDIVSEKDENKFASNLMQNIEENVEYYENQKEIKELQEKVKEEEKKRDQMLQSNKEEIQQYIEKIISLQNKLINSDQGDIVALEESIKIDIIQINNLTVTYQRLKEENEKEKFRMINLINKEIIPLQKELKNEISEVQKLKRKLKQWENKTPPRDLIKKIEVVMKYKKHCS